jgi:hypothetical protein
MAIDATVIVSLVAAVIVPRRMSELDNQAIFPQSERGALGEIFSTRSRPSLARFLMLFGIGSDAPRHAAEDALECRTSAGCSIKNEFIIAGGSSAFTHQRLVIPGEAQAQVPFRVLSCRPILPTGGRQPFRETMNG